MKNIIQKAVDIIRNTDCPPLRIMEVCGTHTHEIFRLGIRKILPDHITMISGPGCPVCVTPTSYIDEAVLLAAEKNVTICTFGDLVRVPGTERSLADVRAAGGEVMTVYSPLDAEAYAREHPEKQVVFLSVGFETTTPADCLSVRYAEQDGIRNYAILTSNKTMPEAYRAMAGSTDVFLYPGHVHAITGTGICRELREKGVSGVVAGFTAAELTTAIAAIVLRAKTGEPFFENCYPRVVRDEGNPAAMKIIEEYMEPCDAEWRGIGSMKDSGLRLKEKWSAYDARIKFDLPALTGRSHPACRCGDILRGACLPADCPLFGKVCTPDHPVGACMVSGEGTCSAYYTYN